MDEQIDLRLVWASDKSLQTIYANQFHISHAGDEFYLTFGELPAPLIFGLSPAEIRERLGETVEIAPLVRVAITPQAMLKIAEVITANVANYISKSPSEETEQ